MLFTVPDTGLVTATATCSSHAGRLDAAGTWIGPRRFVPCAYGDGVCSPGRRGDRGNVGLDTRPPAGHRSNSAGRRHSPCSRPRPWCRPANRPDRCSAPTPSTASPPPFADQPVQGFSGIVRNRDGNFDVLSDNGYGNRPTAPTSCCASTGCPGLRRRPRRRAWAAINLTDPGGVVTFPLTRPDRLLTGADFDVESIVRLRESDATSRAARIAQTPIGSSVEAPDRSTRSRPPRRRSPEPERRAAAPRPRGLHRLVRGRWWCPATRSCPPRQLPRPLRT